MNRIDAWGWAGSPQAAGDTGHDLLDCISDVATDVCLPHGLDEKVAELWSPNKQFGVIQGVNRTERDLVVGRQGIAKQDGGQRRGLRTI